MGGAEYLNKTWWLSWIWSYYDKKALSGQADTHGRVFILIFFEKSDERIGRQAVGLNFIILEFYFLSLTGLDNMY